MNFCDQGIEEDDWNAKLKEIAYGAYEDQCSPANPRVPLVDDMVEILKKAYKGN
jgi:acetaldehyde dehydrogenase/alcohol dehydrogenase